MVLHIYPSFFSALAMALCVAMIAFVRLPSLKVSVLLLFGLLVYDVFWVSLFANISLESFPHICFIAAGDILYLSTCFLTLNTFHNNKKSTIQS